MNKFQTIAEIRTAKAKLHIKKEFLEDEIREDFNDLKESLRPINLVKDLFTPGGNNLNGKEISPVALNLGSTVLDLVLSKLIFRKSSFVKKFLASYFIHATGPGVIQKYAPAILHTFKTLLHTFSKNNKAAPYYEQSTAGNWEQE